MEKIFKKVQHFVKTLICFIVASLLIPIILLSFIFVHYSDELVNYVLSIKYPYLTISKTKKIRSLIDTPKNAGIFNFLLQIKGSCSFEDIKLHYDKYLISARGKSGQLKFPKLQQKLVNCWGHYGWMKDNSSFNLNNHILLNNCLYRGRPVHDGNITEFVSDLVAKYIPSDLPQWQVTVIPTVGKTASKPDETSLDEHYYVLVKVHHLIIAEEDDLHISEMLMLHDSSDREIITIGDLSGSLNKSKRISYFVRKPKHIENLLRTIGRLIVSQWNKFIYEFESLEGPDDSTLVQINSITQLLSVFLIVAVNVIMDFWRISISIGKLKGKASTYDKFQATKNFNKYNLFNMLLHKEINKRHLNWEVVKSAITTSLQPGNLAKKFTTFLWQINVNSFIKIPYHLCREFGALHDIVFKGQTTLKSTYCYRLYVYLPLIFRAQIEVLRICYEVYKAPVNIYEELFEYPTNEQNKLHKLSYAGRKIVSFTKSIDAKAMRNRFLINDQVLESDFVLSCLSGSLRDYFELYSKEITTPAIINTTCRTISKDYLTDHSGDKADHIGGVVFLSLPLRVPDLEHVRQIHQIVDNIRRKQIMIYFSSLGQTKYDMLTSLFPSVFTKICINYFSHHFPVTITEIHGENSQFQSMWGQVVEDVLLFRPPQSKTCLSLNIHRFGDKYRLAIMADTLLGQDHSVIARSFEYYMENVIL